MDDGCSAKPELGKPERAAQERRRDFFLLPSVGTWLQAHGRCSSAAAQLADAGAAAALAAVDLEPAVASLPAELAVSACLVEAQGSTSWEDVGFPAQVPSTLRPPFCLRASVGTWLFPRFDEDSSWSRQFVAKVGVAKEETDWEADFDAFLAETACVNDKAPGVAVVSTSLSEEKVFSASVPGRSSSGLVLLSPPPPPTSRFSVQTAARAADPVVIEALVDEREVKPKEEKAVNVKQPKRQLSTTEELIGTNRAPDDDEEGLLGDDAVGLAEGVFRHRPPGDGVDSASDSDVGEQRVTASAARKPPLPVEPRQPVAMVTLDSQPLPAPPEEPPAKWEPLNVEVPHVNATEEPGPPNQDLKATSNSSQAAGESPKPLKEGTPVAPRPSQQAPLPSASMPTTAEKASQPSATGGMRPAAWIDVDSQVAKRLDSFFGDHNAWERVSTECQSRGASRPSAEEPAARPAASDRFRVRVPAPHPGLQYRRSKQLGDRYQRYVENGSTVTGQVEDDGAWLRLSHNVFLPMRIDGNQVLEALPRGTDPARPAATAGSSANPNEQLSWIWGWCTGCRDGAVMVDADILVRGDAPRTGASPPDVSTSYTSR